MAALWNRAGHYIVPCGLFYLFSSPNLSRRRLDVNRTWCGLSVNLRCRSETCCTRIAENTGPKKSPKIRHLRTIAQLRRAVSSQLRHVSTIRKQEGQRPLTAKRAANFNFNFSIISRVYPFMIYNGSEFAVFRL